VVGLVEKISIDGLFFRYEFGWFGCLFAIAWVGSNSCTSL
jgi:hypothetical protein